MAGTVTRRLEIVNEKGLHARASAKLVELVEGFVGGFETDELDVLSQTQLFGNVQRSGNRVFGVNGKDADLVFGIAVAAENQAESANDQERKQEVPAECGPVT